MTIAFFSNFLNHHQLPLCRAFLAKTDVEFVFVATEPIAKDRLAMGYEDMNAYPFVLRTYESKENEAMATRIAESYDVVIFGATPKTYIQSRMEKNLLSFRFCERSLKKGAWRRFIPRTRKKIHEEYIRYKDKNLYILGASAYTAHDLVLCGFDENKCFKWGYFPEVKQYDDIVALIAAKKPASLLWCGRLIDWKHPEVAIETARRLKKDGHSFEMTLIGAGELEKSIHSMIEKYKLSDCVRLLGPMSPTKVREHMEKSEIFLFTSDHGEGWGAVANEAMNSACALLASHAVGSAPYLIKQGENGFIYECGNAKDLSSKLKHLLQNKELRHRMGANAYSTLKETWDAEIAANRLLTLCEKLKKNEEPPVWKDGPCSHAKIIKNNWMKQG